MAPILCGAPKSRKTRSGKRKIYKKRDHGTFPEKGKSRVRKRTLSLQFLISQLYDFSIFPKKFLFAAPRLTGLRCRGLRYTGLRSCGLRHVPPPITKNLALFPSPQPIHSQPIRLVGANRRKKGARDRLYKVPPRKAQYHPNRPM